MRAAHLIQESDLLGTCEAGPGPLQQPPWQNLAAPMDRIERDVLFFGYQSLFFGYKCLFCLGRRFWLKPFRFERSVILFPGKTSQQCLAGDGRQGHSQCLGSRRSGRWHHQVACNRQASNRSQSTKQRARPRSRLEFGGCSDRNGQPSRPRSRCPKKRNRRPKNGH